MEVRPAQHSPAGNHASRRNQVEIDRKTLRPDPVEPLVQRHEFGSKLTPGLKIAPEPPPLAVSPLAMGRDDFESSLAMGQSALTEGLQHLQKIANYQSAGAEKQHLELKAVAFVMLAGQLRSDV